MGGQTSWLSEIMMDSTRPAVWRGGATCCWGRGGVGGGGDNHSIVLQPPLSTHHHPPPHPQDIWVLWLEQCLCRTDCRSQSGPRALWGATTFVWFFCTVFALKLVIMAVVHKGLSRLSHFIGPVIKHLAYSHRKLRKMAYFYIFLGHL